MPKSWKLTFTNTWLYPTYIYVYMSVALFSIFPMSEFGQQCNYFCLYLKKYLLFSWFQASAMKQKRTAFFWGITQRIPVIPYRCFATNYRSRQAVPRASVRNYDHPLHNNAEECNSQVILLPLNYTSPHAYMFALSILVMILPHKKKTPDEFPTHAHTMHIKAQNHILAAVISIQSCNV